MGADRDPLSGAYAALAELAARELALVESQRYDELPALHSERAALVALLPARAPAGTRGDLERAIALQSRTTALLQDALRVVARELDGLRHGRDSVRGYAPPAGRSAGLERIG